MIDIKSENIITYDESSTSSIVSFFKIIDESGKNVFYLSNDEESEILSLLKSNKICIDTDISDNKYLNEIKDNLFRVDYIVYSIKSSRNLESDILFTISMLRKITTIPIFVLCSKSYINKYIMKETCNKKDYNLYEFTYDKAFIKLEKVSYNHPDLTKVQFEVPNFKDCYFIEDLLKGGKSSFESLKEKYIRGLKIKDILSDDDL